ncbi:MAG: AAA family ATPase [Nitrospirales bacterium]|nr:AAA family ATPase [Nitrospirales bacterium]
MSAAKSKGMDLNEQFVRALRIMEETEKHVFITGRAGTGKSTLLQHFRNTTKKEIAVLAPTGVAAINVKGQTIHSFFGFRPDITPETVKDISPWEKTLYKKLKAIVIDEISMVRADLLDCIDGFLRIYGRKKGLPFGGIQMIFIGDLYQLPPVVRAKENSYFSLQYRSPYFFDSKVFGEGIEMELIELEKVYRQRDEGFLVLLNAIRNNTATDREIEEINRRYIPDFRDDDGLTITLTTTNDLADGINAERLSGLKGKEHRFQGRVEGDFERKDLPTGLAITVKKGAQVMLLTNDPEGWWVNGSIGRVVAIEKRKDEPDRIRVELPEGDQVDILPHTWEMFELHYQKETKRIASEVVGRFTQYPLKLAWAVTIHKSQGLTFDKAIIDIGRGTFTHGQLYVALSRCTSLEGIVLRKPIMKRHILMDRRVVDFVTRFQYKQAKTLQSPEERISLIEQAIRERKDLEILYLKTKDEKTRRVIRPSFVGEMEYSGRKFRGVRGFCLTRMEERVFHLDRILEMKLKH